jgi:hypothetical protein
MELFPGNGIGFVIMLRHVFPHKRLMSHSENGRKLLAFRRRLQFNKMRFKGSKPSTLVEGG